MSKGSLPLRALPRVFLPGVDMSAPVELPVPEVEKLRKVLRLGTGDEIAILPDDGSLWRCRLDGRHATPQLQAWPGTEPVLQITLALGLPKADRLETAIRMGTEIGVSRFVIFPAERSVVHWDSSKLEAKWVRLRTIVREAAEQSFRSRLPSLVYQASLEKVIESDPDAIVLSESEDVERTLWKTASDRLRAKSVTMTLVVGPEGGWTSRENGQIGDRGVTLGPLVLRTDTAGPAAAATVIFGAYAASLRNSDRA